MEWKYINISDIRKNSDNTLVFVWEKILTHNDVIHGTNDKIIKTFIPIDYSDDSCIEIDPLDYGMLLDTDQILQDESWEDWFHRLIEPELYKNMIYEYTINLLDDMDIAEEDNRLDDLMVRLWELYEDIRASLSINLQPKIDQYKSENNLVDCIVHEWKVRVYNPIIEDEILWDINHLWDEFVDASNEYEVRLLLKKKGSMFEEIIEASRQYLVSRYHTEEDGKINIIELYHTIIALNAWLWSPKWELHEHMYDLLTADIYSVEWCKEILDDFYGKYIEDTTLEMKYQEFKEMVDFYVQDFFEQNPWQPFTIKKFIEDELWCYGDKYRFVFEDDQIEAQSSESLEDIDYNISLLELYRQLDSALEKEAYEQATEIRDIIKDKISQLSIEELKVLLEQAMKTKIKSFIEQIQQALNTKGSQSQ